jgi:hypothetical protein
MERVSLRLDLGDGLVLSSWWTERQIGRSKTALDGFAAHDDGVEELSVNPKSGALLGLSLMAILLCRLGIP